MSKGSLNVSLKGADDIFSTEESRQEQQREQVQQIPIGELFPFKNHPFKVLDDESMQRTVESVEQYGVLSPLIARPRPEGGYEIISGHRRQHAAQLAGLDTLPVIVRNMDDDAAVLLMVDSNLQRENQYKPIHKQLAKVKPEKREQFEQRHSRELILYDAAAWYLKELKDSGEGITPKAWQREIDQLTAGKQTDTLAMKSMREDLKAVERLRKTAEQLSRQERDKSHDRGPER